MAGATRPLLPLAAVTAGLASGSSLAAEWMFTPSADILTQTQQNPGLSTDEDRQHTLSNGFGASAVLGVQRRTERTTLTLSPIVRAYRFTDNNNFDRDEQQLNLGFDWLGETASWNATARGTRDTTLTSELGTTGLTQGNQRHESWGASLGPTWQLSERWELGSSVATDANRYPDRKDGLSDYRYHTAVVSTTWAASEQIALTVYGTAGKLVSEGSAGDTDDRSANLQIRYAWSPLTSFGVSIGRSWVMSDSGGNRKGLLYNVTASHSFEHSSLTFTVSRRQSPSGYALLTESEEARLGFSTQLAERLTLSAAASYSKRRNVLQVFDIDLDRVRYTRADLDLSWRLASSWKVGLTVGGGTQQIGSGFTEENRTGRGYDLRLGLSWNGDPYVR